LEQNVRIRLTIDYLHTQIQSVILNSQLHPNRALLQSTSIFPKHPHFPGIEHTREDPASAAYGSSCAPGGSVWAYREHPGNPKRLDETWMSLPSHWKRVLSWLPRRCFAAQMATRIERDKTRCSPWSVHAAGCTSFQMPMDEGTIKKLSVLLSRRMLIGCFCSRAEHGVRKP
jgi:hypothetical protein